MLSHAGEDFNSQTGAIVPAIQTSTTFARDRNYQLNSPEFLYGRDDNVLFKNIEELICQLENGEESRVFASGMASISAVFSFGSTSFNNHNAKRYLLGNDTLGSRIL